MSLEELRRLKLYRHLDQPMQAIHQKGKRKKRIVDDDSSFKLNKMKKYQLQEERNTEIQRDNRMLYERIVNNYRQLPSTVTKRKKWTYKRKLKPQDFHSEEKQYKGTQYHLDNSNVYENKTRLSKNNLNEETFSRIDEINPSRVKKISSRLLKAREKSSNTISVINEQKIMFSGLNQIDGVTFNIKIMMRNGMYYLIGKNDNSKLWLEMQEEEYMRLHRNQLKGNPCQIFKYLEIINGEVRFREENKDYESKRQKVNKQSLVESRNKLKSCKGEEQISRGEQLQSREQTPRSQFKMRRMLPAIF